MPGIIEQLPSSQKVASLVKIDSTILPAGKFQDLGAKVSGMSASVQSIKGGVSLTGVSVDRPPASISSAGIGQSLGGPLGKLKSLNSQSVIGDLSPGHLPVNLPKPADAGFGDLTSKIGLITTAIIPTPAVSAPPPVKGDILAFNVSAMNDDLRRLAIASANAPLRLLSGILKVANQFVVTITDTSNLRDLTLQSLDEIFSQQILILQARLPLYAIDNSTRSFGTPGDAASFPAQYKLLLDEIDTLDPGNIDRLKSILGDGRHTLQPLLRSFAEANRTLGFFAANDTAALTTALSHVLDFTGTGEVFLQPYFDQFSAGATNLIKSIQDPVIAIGTMAAKIQDYLNQAGTAAQQTAQSISGQIKTNLQQAEQFLKDVQKTIQDLQKQISDFIDGVKGKIAPIVGQVKDAISGIGTAIEQFFTQIEQLKQQLDDAVRDLKNQADQKLTDVFNKLADEIRKLLGQITDVLNRKEVQDALDQARQGIEKFKTTVDQASLKPVFDLVISKTGDMETKINGIDVAKMGTPQKVALKVGAKIIEQVKVDEILKPELKEAFEQIRAPLAELITLLKDKALEVENTIDGFNPGTIVANFVSPPFESVIKVLDGFRPSRLLAPLKDANAKLTSIVQELDPQKLIDEIQKVYNELGDALKAFDPAPLNQLVGDAVNVVVSQLGRIRDRDLDSMLNEVKKAISLENLMAATGIPEIAQSDFWDKLRYFLGGGCLDQIATAVDQAGKLLSDQANTLDFSHPMALLKDTVTAVDSQLKADAVLIAKRIGELGALLGPNADALKQLDTRRTALMAKPATLPELKALLADLDLSPLLALSAFAAPAKLDDRLAAVAGVLAPKADSLRKLTQSDYQNAALVIYQKQVSDPVHKLIDQLKTALMPFKTVVDNIQGVLTSLIALPPKIDAAVASVLDAARDGIKQVITATISDIQTFQSALADTLKTIYAAIQEIVGDFSPYWLLTSFSESDFAGYSGAAGSTAAGMLAIARRIASGRDIGGIPMAALLQTKLTASQLQLLQSEVSGNSLQQGNHDNVIAALNALLRDATLPVRDNVDSVKAQLNAQIQTLQARSDRTVDETKALYRAGALLRLVGDAWVDATSGPDKPNATMRLNRLIVEAVYAADVNLGLLSLHALIVQNVAHLYPEQTVQQLDDLYTGILDKVRGLPDQLIRQPLDDEFNKIKAVLKQSFDIAGIFAVLQIKLDAIDGDLSTGLDRLSLAYNHLLETFDQRLSTAA